MKAGRFVWISLMTVMAIDRSSAQTLQAIYSFDFTNGAYPLAQLTLGKDGNLYGTTLEGGSDCSQCSSWGTVFAITTNGILTKLVSFGGTNGFSANGLTLGRDGELYGTTGGGGNGGSGYGTAFKVTANGTLTTLMSFDIANGASPNGLTLGSDGNLYGTTAQGGIINSTNPLGMGTIFEMTTNGLLTTLYSFESNAPGGSLALFTPSTLTEGNDGNFYGTTPIGGIPNSEFPDGMGTVFKITPGGSFTTLASFGYPNGAYPEASLTLGNTGDFYGTTEQGGDANYGTVFKMSTNGTLTTLLSFDLTNGAYPDAPLTLNDGNLYGTTATGGSNNLGTIFVVTTNGALTTLASFGFTNGAYPYVGLTLGTDGNFYSTTELGGDTNFNNGNGAGTVFRLQFTSPVIVSQPCSLTVTEGHGASFAVSAGGWPTLAYRWLFDGMNLPDATNATLTLQNAFPVNAGAYTAVITNAYGSVTSNPAMLTVLPLEIVAPMGFINGEFQFGFDTATGADYTIEYSTNLMQWLPLLTIGGVGAPVTITDPNSVMYPQRFYRVELSPQ